MYVLSARDRKHAGYVWGQQLQALNSLLAMVTELKNLAETQNYRQYRYKANAEFDRVLKEFLSVRMK